MCSNKRPVANQSNGKSPLPTSSGASAAKASATTEAAPETTTTAKTSATAKAASTPTATRSPAAGRSVYQRTDQEPLPPTSASASASAASTTSAGGDQNDDDEKDEDYCAAATRKAATLRANLWPFGCAAISVPLIDSLNAEPAFCRQRRHVCLNSIVNTLIVIS